MTSPTKPRSGSRLAALMSPASSPDSPTASGPCTLMAETMSRFTLPTQHHAGDVEGLGVGDPEAVAELRFLAQAGHELADLGAAAVDHDRAHADGLQQHDVLGEAIGEVRVGHGVAAVLHDHGGAEEAADVGQRLDRAPRPARVASARESVSAVRPATGSRVHPGDGEAGDLGEPGQAGSRTGSPGRRCP